MVSVKIDRIDQLESTERFGVITRLVRRVRVLGLNNTDYKVINSALAEGSIPGSGTKLDGCPSLVLTERNAKLVDDRVIDIDLVYEHGFNEGQNITTPPFGLLMGECKSTVNQVTSNKDINGDTILLQHTFPDDDPQPDGKQTHEQAGEIQYFQPQATFAYKGIKSTIYPGMLARAVIGATNNRPWNGGEQDTWLCTSCNHKPLSLSGAGTIIIPANSFLFEFEFQYNEDGWDPDIAFIDERNQKPATNLVEGVGMKTVRKYRQIDFESVIGTRVQGG